MCVVAGLIMTITTTAMAIERESCGPDECIDPSEDYRAAVKNQWGCLHRESVASNKVRYENIKRCLADFEARDKKGEYYLCRFGGRKSLSDKQSFAEMINSFYGNIRSCEEYVGTEQTTEPAGDDKAPGKQ
jgi:hypothetical protein